MLRLGHQVDVVEGPHPRMYPQIASGAHDLFADAWLPGGHEVYWEQVHQDVVEVGTLYDQAYFFWAVPGYVPAELVSSIADLAKPEVAEQMTTTTVQGTTGAAGLTMRSDRLIKDYGLDQVGWHQVHGNIHAVIDTVNQRMAAGDWFVTPLWQPQFLNEVHDLRPLVDPRGAFPAPDRASLLANRDSWAKLPERTRQVLARVTYPIEAVNEMDLAVNRDGLEPLPAARAWLDRNRQLVETWFA